MQMLYLLCFKNFQNHRCSVGLYQFCPRSRIGRQTTDKIINPLDRLVPVDATSILEYFGSRTQFAHYSHFFLRNGFHRICKNGIHSLRNQTSAKHHQFIVYNTYIVRIRNRHTNLLDDLSRINLMFQEKSCDARFRITVNHRPVDRCSSTILRQQRSMQIESSQTRHIPNHLRQHSESNHNLQIGIPGTQSLDKRFIFQSFRLEKRQVMLQRILFHRRELHLMSTSSRLVGHRDYPYYIISAFYEAAQGLHRKFRSPHIYNP